MRIDSIYQWASDVMTDPLTKGSIPFSAAPGNLLIMETKSRIQLIANRVLFGLLVSLFLTPTLIGAYLLKSATPLTLGIFFMTLGLTGAGLAKAAEGFLILKQARKASQLLVKYSWRPFNESMFCFKIANQSGEQQHVTFGTTAVWGRLQPSANFKPILKELLTSEKGANYFYNKCSYTTLLLFLELMNPDVEPKYHFVPLQNS
jgi:hypothetical protein